MPGAGALPAGELQNISKRSVGVLTDMGPWIQWVQSFVTPDALYCVYIAPNEEAIREHGRRGPFPVTRIFRINSIIDPTTAETARAPDAAALTSSAPAADGLPRRLTHAIRHTYPPPIRPHEASIQRRARFVAHGGGELAGGPEDVGGDVEVLAAGESGGGGDDADGGGGGAGGVVDGGGQAADAFVTFLVVDRIPEPSDAIELGFELGQRRQRVRRARFEALGDDGFEAGDGGRRRASPCPRRCNAAAAARPGPARCGPAAGRRRRPAPAPACPTA